MCRDGANEELRYSIRSVCKNIENPNIWVIGGKPDWYCGKYIPVVQNKNKYENVANNLRALCASNNIENDFILMNDDFFIMKTLKEIPTGYGGTLKDKIISYKKYARHSSYTKNLINTEMQLEKMGITNALDYAIHTPMPMNKQNLLTIINADDFSAVFPTKIIYGNLFKVEGIKMKDAKVYDRGSLLPKSYNYKDPDTIFLSSNDTSFNILYSYVLKDMFDTKTDYEK